VKTAKDWRRDVSPTETPAQTGTPQTLKQRVRAMTGVNVATCYQCGKCSAGCPMTAEFTFKPHDILRMVERNEHDRLMDDESIWLCLTCEICSERCPNGCDPAGVIDSLREIAIEDGAAHAPRTIRAFHQAFLDQIRLNGRVHELGLVMEYKLRSGDLLRDAATAPAMLQRGKLKLKPQRIRQRGELKRIFATCAAGEPGDPAAQTGRAPEVTS
jgi:heterodisulfide reductase subunit C